MNPRYLILMEIETLGNRIHLPPLHSAVVYLRYLTLILETKLKIFGQGGRRLMDARFSQLSLILTVWEGGAANDFELKSEGG